MKKYLILLPIVFLVFLAACSLQGEEAPVEPSAAGTDMTQQPADSSDSIDYTAVQPEPEGSTAVAGESTVKPDTEEAAADEPDAAEPDSAITSKIAVTEYYQDADGFLIPVTRWIGYQQGVARAAVNGLIDSTITREELEYYGVYPVLPENTEILGINITDGVAVVDFNKKLLDYTDEESERNMVASVVYTMTEFNTIDSVRILINGYPQATLKYGTDVSGLLNRENVTINPAGTVTNGGPAKADIYCFKNANETFTYLLPVSVVCEEPETSPEVLVRLLLDGDPGSGVLSEMPEGALLLDYTDQNGVLTLNFNSQFLQYGGSAREDGIIKQLLYTLKQVDGINMVNILVEGKKAVLPEGTDISTGLVIPRTINDVIDG